MAMSFGTLSRELGDVTIGMAKLLLSCEAGKRMELAARREVRSGLPVERE